MAVNGLSRYFLCIGVTRITDGLTFFLDREPLRFQHHRDNKRIVVKSGDTWQSIASQHLSAIPNAEQLFWVICDFQPEPILDPTQDPEPGTLIYIPAADFVLGTYFADSQRDNEQI